MITTEASPLMAPRHAALHREVTALARALKMEWPRNVLRHSFITYRIMYNENVRLKIDAKQVVTDEATGQQLATADLKVSPCSGFGGAAADSAARESHI